MQTTSKKNDDITSSNRVFRGIRSVILYFPTRLMIISFFVAYMIHSIAPIMETIEEHILFNMLQFLSVKSFYLDGNLLIGSFYSSSTFDPFVTTQGLFIVLLVSLAVSVNTSFRIRGKLFLFVGLLLGAFIVTQLLTIILLVSMGLASDISFAQASIIGSGLTASFVIELALFSTLTLPKRTKIKPVIKRSYAHEYLYLASLLIISFIMLHFFVSMLQLREDSVLAAFAAVNVSSILAFKYYVSYFLFETRTPNWVKLQRSRSSIEHNNSRPLTFLLPAYNEAKTIARLIESIDIAASKYDGKVEIVLVNDGSTDRTSALAREAFSKLKYASYKLFDIQNSGKGFALKLGLEHSTGDMIFRIDADSIIRDDAIAPIMEHFVDPVVGSVSGMIFPLEQKTIWQKIMVLLGCLFVYYKRGQELIDSILCQPGAFSVFRKEALIRAGGWASSQFGEDGEITVRLARYGYRNEFDPRSVAYSEAPATLQELRNQRLRWGMAYYHSRARNLQIIRDFMGPRSIMYMFNMLVHGGGFGHVIYWPFLMAAVLLGISEFDITKVPTFIGIPIDFATIAIFAISIQVSIYIYFLVKFNKLDFIKYIPVMSAYMIILSLFLKIEALGILLSFSGKYKDFKPENHEILRKRMMKGF